MAVKRETREIFRYAAPFATWIALQTALPAAAWAYAVRSAATALVGIFCLWRGGSRSCATVTESGKRVASPNSEHLGEAALSPLHLLAGLLVGVIVTVLWIAPEFSTFNVRADVRYLGRSSFVTQKANFNLELINSNQEVYFSNMHWSAFDVKLGFRNSLTKVFRMLSTGDTGLDYYVGDGVVQDYLGLFVEGRAETMDDGYFPTKGVSVGLRADSFTAVRKWDANQFPVHVIASLNGKFPVSFGRFTLIPQFNFRMIFGPETSLVFANVLGGELPGRYMEHQIPFIGINDAVVVRNQLALLRLDARVRILKNHYVSLMGNAGYTFDGFNESAANGDWLGGVGLGYAYNSIVGPLKATLHWSNLSKKVGFYLSLGYNF